MQDRIPLHPGRIKLTQVSGNIYDMERADEPLQVGTPLNKSNLFDSANETRYGATTPNGALSNLVREWEVTIPTTAWVEGEDYNTAQISVAGMKAVYNPIYAVKISSMATAESDNELFAMLTEMETFDGYVIFRAFDLPDKEMTIRIRGV